MSKVPFAAPVARSQLAASSSSGSSRNSLSPRSAVGGVKRRRRGLNAGRAEQDGGSLVGGSFMVFLPRIGWLMNGDSRKSLLR